MTIGMSKSIDNIFIFSSIILNVTIGVLYIATKLGNMLLVQVYGGIVVSLMIPFTITLIGYVKEKAIKKTVISNALILFYLFLELLLDYVFKIPFREMLALHVFYIIVFYVALFSMMAVSFERNRKMGYVVIATFLMLMGCLTYYLSPF